MPIRRFIPRAGRLLPSTAIALALSVTGGCTWVSGKDVDERRPSLDDDGDSYAASEDCDDNNANINPGMTETWYDGIDQDCGRDDDYDADGDGYVADEYLGLATAEVDGSGSLPAGDCDDTDAGANPGEADTWYDGTDTDCDGRDDYDQDEDGYVLDEYQGLATDNADGTGALPGGDCDDTLATVSPASTDDWYDGVDQDCAGNDDYDADGDGFVPDLYDGATTQYVDGSGDLPAGDCRDDNAAIFPGATDTWYDDIDQDCAEDDDFDKDLDGYRHPSAPGGEGNDCDDTDPETYPGHAEDLEDPADRDCDGDGARFIMEAVPSVTWTSPRDLRWDENSSTLYLSIVVDQATYGSSTVYDSVLALTWDSTAPFDGPTGQVAWLRNLTDPTFSLTEGQGFLATDDELVGAIGLTFTSTGNRALRVGGYDLGSGDRFGVNSPTADLAAFDDVTLAVDGSGIYHAVGCEADDGVGRYIRASRDDLETRYDLTEEITDLTASICALHFFDDPQGALLSVQDDVLVKTPFAGEGDSPWADVAACRDAGGDTGGGDTGGGDTGGGDTGGGDTGTVTIDCPDAETTDDSWTPNDVEIVPGKPWFLVADQASDAVVIVFPSGVEQSIPVTDPMFARATVGPDNTIYVAYVDGSGTPGLAWGTVALGFTQLELDPGFSAVEAGVEVTAAGDVLLFSAIGTSEVSWGAVEL